MLNTFESYTALVEMIGEESALKLIKSVDGGTIYVPRHGNTSAAKRKYKTRLPKRNDLFTASL